MCISVQYRQGGLWAWMVLFAAWLSTLAVGGITYSVAVVLPTIRDHFGKTRQSSAWIASIAVAVIHFMGPLTGILNNRFGCRITAILGGILCSAGLVISSFAQQLEFMYFSYGIVFGCGGSFINLTAFVVVTNSFTKCRPLAVGIVAGGIGCGNLVLSPSVGFLLSQSGWRNVFRILAGITAVLIFASCVYRPKHYEFNDENAAERNANINNEHRRRMFDCSIWTNYRWVLVTLAAGLGYFAKAIGQVNLAQHAKDIGVSEADFANLYLFMGLTGTFARPGSGLLCQIKKIKALFVLQMSILILGITFLLLPTLTSYSLMVVFVLLFGVGDGVLVACGNVCILKCFNDPVKKISGFGISMLWISFAFVVGPPLSGHMADVYGTFNPSFYLAGACCILAVVIICFIPCLKKSPDLQTAEAEPALNNSDANGQITVHESAV